MELKTGQTAVITGAASGIGLALAAAFATRGLNVVMADIDETALQSAAAGLRGAGAALTVRCDVSRPEEVEQLRDAALARFGRIDILCNNAGVILPFRPLWTHEATDWDWLLGINLHGVINGLRTFLPLLVEQRSGHVLNTASMAGVSTIAFNGPYNAAKHAVVALTETIAAEMAELGIPVGASVLCTGLVSTNIRHSARHRPGAMADEGKQEDSATAPAESAQASISPQRVADMTLAGIEADRLHIFTNPGSAERVQARIDRLLANLPE
ncbi:Short-chain dehydrogenase [Sphingobium faniae]|nr:Short-chain dehydrogenase [Sphingobium faniae]